MMSPFLTRSVESACAINTVHCPSSNFFPRYWNGSGGAVGLVICFGGGGGGGGAHVLWPNIPVDRALSAASDKLGRGATIRSSSLAAGGGPGMPPVNIAVGTVPVVTASRVGRASSKSLALSPEIASHDAATSVHHSNNR